MQFEDTNETEGRKALKWPCERGERSAVQLKRIKEREREREKSKKEKRQMIFQREVDSETVVNGNRRE